MPNYNKKSFSKKNKQHRKKQFTTQFNDSSDDIFMSDDEVTNKKIDNPSPQNKTKNKRFKVVNGGKKSGLFRNKVLNCILCVFVIILLSITYLSPVSLFETLGNTVVSLGVGKFPANEAGNETLEAFKHKNTVFVLTDTAVECYNLAGKKIFSDLHGISNPVLVNSPARVLLYEQGGNTVTVYSETGQKIKFSTDNSIYCAAISKSGVFALATECDGFASMFTVYDKKGNTVFSWSSPDMIVNAITLSTNGKKAAAAMISTDNGNLVSRVSVFDFKNSNPLNTIDFSGEPVYNLYCNSYSEFGILLKNAYKSVKWNKFTVTDNVFEFDTSISRLNSSKITVCSSLGSDRTNNNFTVLKLNGVKYGEFSLQRQVNDFAICGNKIFVLSNTEILLVDMNGNVLESVKCDFGVVKILAVNSKCVLALTDNKIEKITI